jgi:hypothetical protein
MATNLNPISPDALLKIVVQITEYSVEPPSSCQRGRPRAFSGLAFLLLAVVGVVLRTFQPLPTNPEAWQRALVAYRRETMELLFQRIIQACDLKACPTKGLARTGTFVLASVWLYLVLFLDTYRHHRPVAPIKEIIDEGRWRIAA